MSAEEINPVPDPGVGISDTDADEPTAFLLADADPSPATRGVTTMFSATARRRSTPRVLVPSPMRSMVDVGENHHDALCTKTIDFTDFVNALDHTGSCRPAHPSSLTNDACGFSDNVTSREYREGGDIVAAKTPALLSALGCR